MKNIRAQNHQSQSQRTFTKHQRVLTLQDNLNVERKEDCIFKCTPNVLEGEWEELQTLYEDIQQGQKQTTVLPSIAARKRPEWMDRGHLVRRYVVEGRFKQLEKYFSQMTKHYQTFNPISFFKLRKSSLRFRRALDLLLKDLENAFGWQESLVQGSPDMLSPLDPL